MSRVKRAEMTTTTAENKRKKLIKHLMKRIDNVYVHYCDEVARKSLSALNGTLPPLPQNRLFRNGNGVIISTNTL